MNLDYCLSQLICPVCARPLLAAPGRWHCAAGHSFDLARQGYVNLLPARGRKGQSQGDSGEMLWARRRFLEGGGYQPLLDAVIVAATAVAARHPVPGFTVLDAGCGEGFYLSRLQTALAREDGCFLGLDLSKTAARMAAAANKSALFFVGDLRERITCADHTVHLLLNIFAPRNPAEFARVMASHGRLLTLIPTPRHLQGLLGAEDVIGMETAKEEKVEAAMAPYFDLLVVEEITFPLTVQGEQLVDLVQMTPRARHLPPEKYTQMRRWSAVDTTVSVQMLLFAPKPDGLLPTG